MMCAAIQEGDLDYVKAHFHGVYEWNLAHYTPLGYAVRRGHYDIVRWLIVEGNVDVNEFSENGNWAAIHEFDFTAYDQRILPLLLRAGANPNAKQESRWSAVQFVESRTLRQHFCVAEFVTLLFAWGATLHDKPSSWIRRIYDKVQTKREHCRVAATIILHYMWPRDVARMVAHLVWEERRNV